MFRGLMKMAAIAGAGYAWRKFRNRGSSGNRTDRSSFAASGRSASFKGTERRFGSRDRRIAATERTPVGAGAGVSGGSAYGTAGSSSSYSTGAGSGAGTGSLAGSGTSGMTGGGSVGSSRIRTEIGE